MTSAQLPWAFLEEALREGALRAVLAVVFFFGVVDALFMAAAVNCVENLSWRDYSPVMPDPWTKIHINVLTRDPVPGQPVGEHRKVLRSIGFRCVGIGRIQLSAWLRQARPLPRCPILNVLQIT